MFIDWIVVGAVCYLTIALVISVDTIATYMIFPGDDAAFFHSAYLHNIEPFALDPLNLVFHPRHEYSLGMVHRRFCFEV